MLKIKTFALITGGFVAGSLMVVAGGAIAGHHQTVAALDTTPMTVHGSHFYTVRNRTSHATDKEENRQVESTAECQPGDNVVGGGCWVYGQGSTEHADTFRNAHHPVAFGPAPATPMPGDPDVNDVYSCVYDNMPDDVGVVVVATAICAKR